MDPTILLEEIRDLADRIAAGEVDVAPLLAKKVKKLDDWLERGGFLPKPWRRQNNFSLPR